MKKKIFALCLTLFVFIQAFASDVTKNPASDKEAQYMAQVIIELYTSCTQGSIEDNKQAADLLGLEISKKVQHLVQPNALVDSTIYENNQLQRWATMKRVDLQYLQSVEFMITIKYENAGLLAQEIRSILKNQGKMEKRSNDQNIIQFIDRDGAMIVDNRFVKNKISEIKQLYTYKIEVMEDYLMIDINEVFPEQVIQSEGKVLALEN